MIDYYIQRGGIVLENNKCHVAILDDGVSKLFFQIPPFFEEKYVTEECDSPVSISHATIVANIIQKYSNNCIFTSIKVLDNNGDGTLQALIKGVELCLEMNVDIIHMSIGTTRFYKTAKLVKLLERVAKKKICVIAAQSNSMLYTIPACLNEVIGVRHSDECLPEDYIIQINNWDGVDILTSSRHHITIKNEGEKILLPSNSFAAPYITSLIANIISEKGRMPKSQIINELCKNAKRIKHTDFMINDVYDHKTVFSADYNFSRRLYINRQAHVPVISLNCLNQKHIGIANKIIAIFNEMNINIYPALKLPDSPNTINWQQLICFVELKYDIDAILINNINELSDIIIEFEEKDILLKAFDQIHIISIAAPRKIVEKIIELLD